MTRSSIVSRPEAVPITRDPRLADDRTDRFEAFYQSWFPRAVALARQGGLADPESAAQECMMVFHTSPYLDMYYELHKDCAIPDPVQEPGVKAIHVGHDPAKISKLDTWVGRILRQRLISLSRKDLRRRGIAQFEPMGDREFVVEGISPMAEFRDRMVLATDLIRQQYPEWYWLWRSVLMQIFEGDTLQSADRLDYRQLAARADITVSRLRSALRDFVEVCCADPELADLVGVDRAL